jgi:hypothetical protein
MSIIDRIMATGLFYRSRMNRVAANLQRTLTQTKERPGQSQKQRADIFQRRSPCWIETLAIGPSIVRSVGSHLVPSEAGTDKAAEQSILSLALTSMASLSNRSSSPFRNGATDTPLSTKDRLHRGRIGHRRRRSAVGDRALSPTPSTAKEL